MTDQTIFERCVEAAADQVIGCCNPNEREARDTARDVIQTIIDNTGSPYTVDELNRILGEA